MSQLSIIDIAKQDRNYSAPPPQGMSSYLTVVRQQV